MKKYFIIGNFGPASVELAQWAINNILTSVTFLYVDTGFSAASWQEHVDVACAWVKRHGLAFKQLQAKATFQELASQRRQFPSTKFQWCAGFLKGLALNDYLDTVDPMCEATLLFAKVACRSRANELLKEYVDDSEHFNGRALWYPLLNHSLAQLTQLRQQSPFQALGSRSQECQPCIHATQASLSRMHPKDIQRLASLELNLGKNMFEKPIGELCHKARPGDETDTLESLDMGCGSVWGCGE